MRLLCGEIEVDGGSIAYNPGTRVARLSQEVPQDFSGPVAKSCAAASPPTCTSRSGQDEQQVTQILRSMDLDGEALFENHSSGMKRRVMLARLWS